MNTAQAFAMGFANRGKPLKVFDWEKAARLIRERGAQEASAGLAGDWEYTGGDILRDGQPIPRSETYTYLASTWATPEIEIDGEVYDCYRIETDVPASWLVSTTDMAAIYWPEPALAVLRGEA